MAFLHTASFDPCSRRTISWSISHQQQCQLDQNFIDRLDNTEVLGGQDTSGQPIGHTGCVNALSWSPSGQLLASGSDDRTVVLWKLGSAQTHPLTDASNSNRSRSSVSSRYGIGASRRTDWDQEHLTGQPQAATTQSHIHLSDLTTRNRPDDDDKDHIVQPWPQRSFPGMDLGMLGKIETGHRANIFSVKWAPNASERRLFTCAGDSHVRVFDINYMSSTATGTGADGQVHRTSDGREWTSWPEHSGACIRLFRCHRGRAKRISTEVSPDVFLTCGEDGDVRQMDLRAPHTCRSRTGGFCPPPLAHYPSGLYSLSVSKSEPWLFAVAGESSLAYLHDRRMIPRLIRRDWGMSSTLQHDALTMCVRSFGVPPGGFEAPWSQSDGRTALVSETSPSSRHRLLMGNRNSITACKLSEHNGRDLLVSYSSGHIYRFDIYDEPGVLQANLDNVRFSLESDERSPSPEGGHRGYAVKRGPSETSAVASDPDFAVDQDVDQSRNCPENEVEPPIATDDDSGQAGHDDDDDNEDSSLVEDAGDDESSENSVEGDADGDEEGDEEEDGQDIEDDHENDLSEDDLMHLLQEEAHSRSASTAEPAVPTVYPRSAYKGHCNKETVKDVAFAGRADDYVISGSDDGNWFLWDKLTSEIKGIWHGDSSVVNVMAMHPDLPIFAISGIDDTIKIFAPITATPFPPSAAAREEDKVIISDEGQRKRSRTERADAIRAHKLADRLPDRDRIRERNERQLQSDFVTPAASIFWRLHPRLLGIDMDDDPDRPAEGDCIVM